MSSKIPCPKCNSFINEDDIFCMHCGTKIEKMPKPEVPDKEPKKRKLVINMGNSGADDIFVQKDSFESANEIRQDVIVCPVCNTENDPGFKFCISCGTKIKEEVPVVEEEPEPIPVVEEEPEPIPVVEEEPEPIPVVEEEPEIVEEPEPEVEEIPSAVGGMKALAGWLDDVKELLKPEKAAKLEEIGLRAPKSILVTGVPGCGKTISATLVSEKLELPIVTVDKEAAENEAPCVLLMDEIEKVLSTSDDADQLISWLQECEKPVFVVATANDVSKLPSELLHRGIFDEMFYVDLPTAEERSEIIALYMKKYLNVSFDDVAADSVIEASEGFSGAELEAAVRKLVYKSVADDSFELTAETIMTAFNCVKPFAQAEPERVDAIRKWCEKHALKA